MYNLSEQQVNNLKVFLNRINLNANEIPAFLELIKIFQEPIEDTENTEKDGVEDGI
jgi:hypothetical protein